MPAQFAGLLLLLWDFDSLCSAGSGGLLSVLAPDVALRAASTSGRSVFVVSGVTRAPVWPPGSGPMANMRCVGVASGVAALAIAQIMQSRNGSGFNIRALLYAKV